MNPFELPELFNRQFELCAVKNGESIILLTDHNTERALVQAASLAARSHGAEVFEVGIPEPLDLKTVGHDLPSGGQALLNTLKAANLLVVFFAPNLSPWLSACRKAGARVLSITDHPDALKRLQSPEGLKEAVLHAKARYAAARRIRVTSDAGTDLVYERGDPRWSEIRGYYGRADEAGHFDQWGMGMIADFPDEGTAHGRVVIQPGDVWILPYARMVHSEIRLEISAGFVREVEGGLDARLFREWLTRNKRSDDDMDPFAVSHLGIGLNPKAHWDDVIAHNGDIRHLAISARCFAGNFLFSTGPGPHRRTKGHIDMPMIDCNVSFDGDVVVQRGKLVDPGMIVTTSR